MTPDQINRRSFLGRAGVGAAALTSLLGRNAGADEVRGRGILNPLHHRPKAKRVIWLYQAGGPSHLETLDYKPTLAKLHGQPMPESVTAGQPIAQLQGQKLTCFAPQHPFLKAAKSGNEVSSAFPMIASIADELCIVRSLVTDQINHDPAHTFMNTGTGIPGRPSAGAWAWYGLGNDCDNLPGFIVLVSSGGGQDQPIAVRQWSAGMLPSLYQGVQFQSKGDPVLYLGRPPGVSKEGQRDVLDAVRALNQGLEARVDDPEIATRIRQYEMAFKMQSSVPDLIDLSDEPKEVLERYGTQGADGSYASNCLLARRLAERGVRFIQLYHRGWDHHGGVKNAIKGVAGKVDRPTWALITDLKRRGMLDDTLILWGGEFGRTPMAQGDGRDHHIKGFSMFLCGGGVKPGITYGATDEFGYNAVEDVFHVHDFHATMLHLLGVDHKRLNFRFQGLDVRLTSVHGKVVEKILA
jgi:hypothetical protein